MCQDVFEIVQGMDLEDIEMQMALQCAPVITGLKIANLLIVQNDSFLLVEQMIAETDLSCYVVSVTGTRTAVLIYDETRLQDYLGQEAVKGSMYQFGYTDLTLSSVLIKFRKRYQEYMHTAEAFPHEMGLLLGYPVEDVIGFIDNQGENALLTGYWKVYRNPVHKKELFHQFECARDHLIQMVHRGVSMAELIEKYRINSLRIAG